MSTRRRTPPHGAVKRLGDSIHVGGEEIRAFLDSPGGRRMRNLFAGAVVLTAPLVFRIPGLRRYPLIRALELVGGAAIIVKLAEAIRDWDAGGRKEDHIVLDVPPAPPR